MTLLWLDDVRPAPPGWVDVHSVTAAMTVIEQGGVTHASLDHDLGEFAADGGDGIRLTDWMAEHDIWPADGLRVHSSNPVGVKAMMATIKRFGPYGSVGLKAAGTLPPGGWPPIDPFALRLYARR